MRDQALSGSTWMCGLPVLFDEDQEVSAVHGARPCRRRSSSIGRGMLVGRAVGPRDGIVLKRFAMRQCPWSRAHEEGVYARSLCAWQRLYLASRLRPRPVSLTTTSTTPVRIITMAVTFHIQLLRLGLSSQSRQSDLTDGHRPCRFTRACSVLGRSSRSHPCPAAASLVRHPFGVIFIVPRIVHQLISGRSTTGRTAGRAHPRVASHVHPLEES